ncbi:MAG: hypothetical protein ACLPX7_19235 [Xanthobacteraceae bacterium]
MTDRRIAELKIEQYRRQLAIERFWKRRRRLIRLLAAEEAKLEGFEGRSRKESGSPQECSVLQVEPAAQSIS